MEIFTNFSHACPQVCCYEKVYCYGDLPFQKGCHQCYHNAVDDYKLKVLTLFCTGIKVLHFLLSAMALSRFRQAKSADEEAKLVESAVPKSTRHKK